MATSGQLPTTDPLGMLMQLLQSGGSTTTTSPGDIGMLEQTFANAQGIDPNALLQSIFAQASAQVPGIQNAYANAVGARRGSNSAIQNALSQLLAQTTLQGQKQVMDQRQQLLNTQANVGSAVANATKGSKQSAGPDIGNSIKNLMIMQGLAKLSDTDIGKSLLGTVKEAAGGVANAVANTVGTLNTAPAQAAASGPQMSMAPVTNMLEQFGSPYNAVSEADNLFNNMFSSGTAPAPESQEVYDYLRAASDSPDMGYSDAPIDMSMYEAQEPVEFLPEWYY